MSAASVLSVDTDRFLNINIFTHSDFSSRRFILTDCDYSELTQNYRAEQKLETRKQECEIKNVKMCELDSKLDSGEFVSIFSDKPRY